MIILVPIGLLRIFTCFSITTLLLFLCTRLTLPARMQSKLVESSGANASKTWMLTEIATPQLMARMPRHTYSLGYVSFSFHIVRDNAVASFS